jgi:hypothetical protein
VRAHHSVTGSPPNCGGGPSAPTIDRSGPARARSKVHRSSAHD